VNPDITNATTSGLTNQDYKTALVGVTETLIIVARDKYGNKQIHLSDVFEVKVISSSNVLQASTVTPTATNGEYQI
jgi:hypothetical protein